MMAPQLAQAARRLAPRLRVAKLNTEDCPGASQRFAVRSIPLLVASRSERAAARQAGAMPAAQIEAWARGAIGAAV